MRRPIPARCPLALALAAVTAAGALALLAAPRPVSACGGCFSPTTAPTDDLVVQDSERVLFHRDPTSDVTTVWVEVRYAGAAEDFGWVLPLEKPPVVGTGPRYVFDLLDQRFGVEHRLTNLGQENCHSPWEGCEPPTQYPSDTVLTADTTASDTSGGGFDGGPTGVSVIDQGQTGPYDYVVVAADDAQLLYTWLNDRGYATPASATPILESHIAKGDVFVAVKLQNDKGVDLIRPLTLTMDGADPCVPLRLTSIAARDDMTVSVTLAGPGRAVPKNHLNVVVNPLRLNWWSSPPANNYTQVMAAAIDEAGGHAFVTEFAGRGTRLGATASDLRSAVSALAATTRVYDVGAVLASRSAVPVTDETAAIFADAIPLDQLAPGVSAAKALAVLRACVGSWEGFFPSDTCTVEGVTLDRPTLEGTIVDGVALAAAFEADFVTPAVAALDLLKGAPTLTRLMMRISPDEMDRDPIFDFNPALPDVANVVVATTRGVCTDGWSPADARRLTIDGLGSWVMGYDTTSSALHPRFSAAPLALRMELLDATGQAKLIAPADIPLVDTAIAGATPGTPSLPAELVLTEASPWTPPATDPAVSGRGPWPKPYGCDPKSGWKDGQLPPGEDGPGPTGGDTSHGDADADADASGTDGGAGGTSRGGSGGCAGGAVPVGASAVWAFVALAWLRRRARRPMTQV